MIVVTRCDALSTIAESGTTTVHDSIEENQIYALGLEVLYEHVVIPKENGTHHGSAEHPTTS
jgi:hypothetical protein